MTHASLKLQPFLDLWLVASLMERIGTRPARCRRERVSTDEQDLNLQVDSLIGLGVAGDFRVLPVLPSLGV